MNPLTPRQQLHNRDKEVLTDFYRQVPRAGRVRRPFTVREKTSYLILRRKGLRIQHIAELFGRSTSVIHRALKKAQKHGYNLDVWRRTLDMRKIPYLTRMRSCIYKRLTMWKLADLWHAFALGVGDKPP